MKRLALLIVLLSAACDSDPTAPKDLSGVWVYKQRDAGYQIFFCARAVERRNSLTCYLNTGEAVEVEAPFEVFDRFPVHKSQTAAW